jgi:hypothetical protein
MQHNKRSATRSLFRMHGMVSYARVVTTFITGRNPLRILFSRLQQGPSLQGTFARSTRESLGEADLSW